MHLFINPTSNTTTCEICLDGNTTTISVSDIPEGLHSISINVTKYLVYIDDTQRHIPLDDKCQLVSILSVISCLYPEQSDWFSLTNLITLETFRSVIGLESEEFAQLIDIDNINFKFTAIPSERDAHISSIETNTDLSLDNLSIKDRSSVHQGHAKDNQEESDQHTNKSPRKTQSDLNTENTNLSKYQPTKLTQAYLMKSDLLVINLQKLLQELQLSFVLFSFFQSEQAYTHYKAALNHLTHLIVNANTLPVYLRLVGILMIQVKCFPRDFFRDPLSKGSFLEECLKSLYSFVCEDVIESSFFELKEDPTKYHLIHFEKSLETVVAVEGNTKDNKELKTLKQSVEKLGDVVFEWFDWDMRCELDDELPTIVYE